jgi:hypothetical protein
MDEAAPLMVRDAAQDARLLTMRMLALATVGLRVHEPIAYQSRASRSEHQP